MSNEKIINEESGEEISAVDLDKMLHRVQMLLTKADHPNTGEEEAATYRAKAEDLMRRFRIEEHEAMKADPGSAIRPVVKVWKVCDGTSQFYNQFYSMLCACCDHAGVRLSPSWGPDPETGEYSLLATMVGFESDVRFAFMLYVNMGLAFSSRLDPTFSKDLSDDDNVYNLRSAGMERIRIARIMGWGTTNSATARVTAAYKRACRARGEDPTVVGRNVNAKTYRASFASSFVSRMYSRLREMRLHAGQDQTGELVLADRKDLVDEAFYQQFPDKRPMTAEEREKAMAKSGSTGRKPRYRAVRTPYSPVGWAAGAKAADTVDLTNPNPKRARGVEA